MSAELRKKLVKNNGFWRINAIRPEIKARRGRMRKYNLGLNANWGGLVKELGCCIGSIVINICLLQYFSCYPSTCLCISKCVMMVFQLITTGGSYGLKLVVFQVREYAPRNAQCVVELIIWIVHLIYAKNSLQTTFVKRLVMSNEWQVLYQRLYLSPYFWKNWCIVSIFMAETMYLAAPVVIIVGLGLYERVERIYYLTITNNDYSNGTNRRTLVIGCFEIYCCKVFHLFVLLVFVPHSFNLSGNFFTEPERFQHFQILTVPEKFLLEVKLWTEIKGGMKMVDACILPRAGTMPSEREGELHTARRHNTRAGIRADILGKRFPLFVSSFLVLLAKKVGMCACIKQDEDKFLFAYFPDE